VCTLKPSNKEQNEETEDEQEEATEHVPLFGEEKYIMKHIQREKN
jgi:hypothetical protein